MIHEHTNGSASDETTHHNNGSASHEVIYHGCLSEMKISSNLKHLTSDNNKPYLQGTGEPNDHHQVPLSSILDSHSQNAADGGIRFPTNMHGQANSCSCKILVYDASSTHDVVKEFCFSAEDDFDTNIIELLRPFLSLGAPPEDEQSKEEMVAHDSNPLLCEAVLRCVYAQGKSVEFSVHEKQSLSENVKRAFCLSASAFQEAKARAIKSTWYRRAQVQVQISDLQKDNGQLINPQQFDSFSVYEEVKSQELEQLASINSPLQTRPTFTAHVQLCIVSAKNSNYDTYCIKTKSCYGWSEPPQVYCTVEIVSGSENLTDVDNISPDHITKEAVYHTGHAEWKDKTPWIHVTSAQDQLYVKMWRKKLHSRISNRSNDLDLVSLWRNVSGKKKVTCNGDTLLGKIMLPMHLIKTQALSSGSIRGKIPLKSYTLRNAQERKLPISLEMEIEFFCELLISDPTPDEKLLNPPIRDLELGYDALVQVAYGMHLEGDFELEASWKNILFCYESYYRIRRETCGLTLLKHLTTLFQPESQYLGILVRELQPICKLAKEGKLRKSEYLLLSNIISLLVKPSIDAIEDFQSNLSLKQLNGAFSKLIQLLSLLLCWDVDVKGVAPCIKRWMKVSCVQRFNKHLIENSNGGEITSRTFSKAISCLQKDLSMLHTCCKQEPLEDLGIFQTCASEYYELVSRYIIGVVGSVKISSIDFEDLTREMSLLHQELEKSNMNLELLDLRGLLHEHILDLITSVKSQMMDWVISSLNDEKWEPTSPQTNIFFSCSVVDLYFMINGVIENLTTRLSYFPFGKYYYFNIEESIFSVIETYVKMTEKFCLQELADNPPEEYHQFFSNFKSDSGVKPICISKALCVKLNNLHAVMQEQCTFETNLMKKWENYVGSSNTNDSEGLLIKNRVSDIKIEEQRVGQLFKNIYSLVKDSLSHVTGSIVQCMQKELAKRLRKFIQRYVPQGTLVIEDLQILTMYLDDHLKVLNEWSDRPVFKSLLLETAATLLFCMEEVALNRAENSSSKITEQCDCLEHALNLLYDYFHGDGIGISSTEMDSICERFRKILECSRLDTHELCAFYWKAWDKLNDEVASAPHAFSQTEERRHLQVVDYLLLLQQRDDDEAQIIVTNQKLLAKSKMTQTSWIPEYQFEMPKDVLRGVTEYFKSIQTTPFNISYPTFEKMKRW